MICETCHGNGFVFTGDGMGSVAFTKPCPECIGGHAHCCEGEQWSDREREIEQVKK